MRLNSKYLYKTKRKMKESYKKYWDNLSKKERSKRYKLLIKGEGV